MKRTLILLLALLLAVTAFPISVAAETAQQTVTVSDQTVTTHGRTYYADGYLWFNWTYSGFSFAFNGTAAKGVFKSGEHNNAYLNVYVDDSDVPVNTIILKGTERTFTLVEGLEEGEHTVTVRKRTENRGNATAGVKELILTGSLSETLPVKPEKTIEVIGDSITCGFGSLVDGTKQNAYRAVDQDGARTYATLATSRFDAETTVVARSGIGFAYNNGGSNVDTMKDAYGYTDYIQKGTDLVWDFQSNPSDVVIIALGTNDTSAPSHQAFADGAKAFLAQVRDKNPDAVIIWAYEVITASFNYMIQEAIDQARENGDDKVYYYALGLIDKENDGVGAGGHPTITTHVKDAKGFARFIADVTGWEMGPENTSVTVKPVADGGLALDDNGLLVAPPTFAGKTVADVKSALAEEELTYADRQGNAAMDTAKAATGMVITRSENEFVTDVRHLCILGDVDQNGQINASDALMILRYSVGKANLSDPQITAAWISGGEEISAVDALRVLQFAVGKINTF